MEESAGKMVDGGSETSSQIDSEHKKINNNNLNTTVFR